MPASHSILAAGGLAVLFTVACVIFLVILASSLDLTTTTTTTLHSIRVGLWVAVAFQAADIIVLVYDTIVIPRRLESLFAESSGKAWREWWLMVLLHTIAVVQPAVMLICAAVDHDEFPKTVIGLRPVIIIGVSFAVWALSALFTIGLLAILGTATHRVVKSQRQRTGVGRREDGRNTVSWGRHETRDVSQFKTPPPSRDTMAAPRPWTPNSTMAASSLRSASTKVGTSSAKAKTARNSIRSSLESPSGTLNDTNVFESAFDRYDTSAIHHEMRNTVLSSSPTIRAGLEPIPGSRSESQLSVVEPQLPSSPLTYPTSNPSTPARPSSATTPTSSPPNFSRPTSKHRNQPFSTPTSTVNNTNNTTAMPLILTGATSANLAAALANPTLPASPTPPPRPPRPSASMTNLIHPLFRPDSLQAPPQINTAATMVTASPLANQPITPKTLSRIRSASDIRSVRPMRNLSGTPGDWKVMPTVAQSPGRSRSRSHGSQGSRPSTAGSLSAAAATSSGIAREGERERLRGAGHAPPPSAFPPALKGSMATAAQTEPPTSKSEVESSGESELHRSNTKASSIGSPGPSIIEDDVAEAAAPILPGFVLSAGARTSLVWYSKRKSGKRTSRQGSGLLMF